MNDAEIVWDYLNVREEVSPADCIFVLCSHDIRIARYAADLYFAGKGKVILFSGGSNPFTKNIYPKTEAESFADVAMKYGVPADKIIIENKSTNTAENFEFSKPLIQNFDSFILVQVPNMLRRVKLTARKFLTQYQVTSHPISFYGGPHPHLTEEMFLHEITGDLQRLQVYPKMGFHESVEIPENVMKAWERLVEKGYTGNFVKKSI